MTETTENAVEAARKAAKRRQGYIFEDAEAAAFDEGFTVGVAIGRADERAKMQDESVLRAAALATGRAIDQFLRHIERTYPGLSLNAGADYSLRTPDADPLHEIRNVDVGNLQRQRVALKAALDATPYEPTEDEVERATEARFYARYPGTGIVWRNLAENELRAQKNSMRAALKAVRG